MESPRSYFVHRYRGKWIISHEASELAGPFNGRGDALDVAITFANKDASNGMAARVLAEDLDGEWQVRWFSATPSSPQ